uniref:Protein lifeguard 2 n=1 Tax=Mastacembelus armatus TaxID=205130 RepID=A0A3Q3KWA0_9TELE
EYKSRALHMILNMLTLILSQQVCDENEPPSYQEATAGYEEMQTQFAWDDKTIRRTFIRKVYAILMVQLFVTVAVVGLFTFCTPVRFFIQTHPSLYMASYIIFFATYIALSCCGDLRRQFPWNILLLVLFTLSMAVMMGFVSSFYNTKSVVLCLGITALVCLSVTIFSFQRCPVLFVYGHAALRPHHLHCGSFWICPLVACSLRCDRSYPLYSGKDQTIEIKLK